MHRAPGGRGGGLTSRRHNLSASSCQLIKCVCRWLLCSAVEGVWLHVALFIYMVLFLFCALWEKEKMNHAPGPRGRLSGSQRLTIWSLRSPWCCKMQFLSEAAVGRIPAGLFVNLHYHVVVEDLKTFPPSPVSGWAVRPYLFTRRYYSVL